MTIRECLQDPRKDIAVSEWLQERWNHVPAENLPIEVRNAYLVNQFLMEVNMGGFLGFFAYEFENVQLTRIALQAVGLADVETVFGQAMQSISPGAWFASRELFDVASEAIMEGTEPNEELDELSMQAIGLSLAIQSALQTYIADHLEVFESLDK